MNGTSISVNEGRGKKLHLLDQLQSTDVLHRRNVPDDKTPETRQKRRLPKPHQMPPKRVKYSGAIPGSSSRVAPTTSPPLSNSKTPPKRRSNRSRNRPTFYSEELYTGQTPKTPGTPKPEPLDSIDDIATGDSVSFFLAVGEVYGCGTFRDDDGTKRFSADVEIQKTPAKVLGQQPCSFPLWERRFMGDGCRMPVSIGPQCQSKAWRTS